MAEKLQKKPRRKSLSVFGSSGSDSPQLKSVNVPSHDRSSSDGTSSIPKPNRRNSSFLPGRNASLQSTGSGTIARPNTADAEAIGSTGSSPAGSVDIAKLRTRSFHKGRRTSVFGSLRSMHSLEDDEKPAIGFRSKGSSGDEEDPGGVSSTKNLLGRVVLHHGEVQTTGGMWRKKSHYLVLTDTHLVRLKNQGKAAEIFPSIASSSGRMTPVSRQSTVSLVSLQDQTAATYSAEISGIPLSHIVAVYRTDEHRGLPAVEICYLEERTGRVVFLALQFSDSEDLNLWLVGIRSAAESVRLTDPLAIDRKTIEYAVRALEHDRDYDPDHFHMFRIVQRSPSKGSNRASSEDVAKWTPTLAYLAIGAHKVHIIPLQKSSTRSSLVSLSECDSAWSFGLMTLTALWMYQGDDSFQMNFRLPLHKAFTISLASVHSADITLWIRQRSEYLRPLWLRQPYDLRVPPQVADDDIIPPVDLDEDFSCFDRTLIAYSASYDIDTSNIRYTVDLECEDAPCFRLLPPSNSESSKYTALELLAVFRALRYNESFVAISFAGVNLDILQGVRDQFGLDLDAYRARSGAQIYISGQDQLSLLSQEIRALALKSKRLRRLDFSFCLTRTPVSDNGVRDPGCGIPEAIFPLCRRQLTNVDWIVLNGIKLGESDLDYLVDAASQRTSHLRALEVGNCGLSVHDLDLVLSTITAQEPTLEAINVAGVQGRLSPELFHQQIGYFGQVRKIDLSRVARTSGPEPLIAPETLLNWRLEELSLSQTVVNPETVDSISSYLASDRSRSLRVLHMDQCGLTGTDVAVFLRSMSLENGRPRNLHLHVSENRLGINCSQMVEMIAQNHTPTHLSMQMIDFKKEDHFRELIEALRVNTSLRYLDISKASLPYDAGPETCRALQLMFEENETLEELDIGGEYAHLDVARFGIGLNQALTGLKRNKSLQVLRIEHQKLGIQGADTLASVLEKNTSLREIYCENNDINLQSFTLLVNGLERNRSICNMPTMDHDRHHSLEKLRRELEGMNRDVASQTSHSAASSLRRTLQAAITIGQPSGGHKLAKQPTSAYAAPPRAVSSHSTTEPRTSFSAFPASTSLSLDESSHILLLSLNQKWDEEVARLRRYLYRNYCLAHDIPEKKEESEPAKNNFSEVIEVDLQLSEASLSSLLDDVQQVGFHLAVDELTPHNEEPELELNIENLDLVNKDTSDSGSGSSSPLLTMAKLVPPEDFTSDDTDSSHARPETPQSVSSHLSTPAPSRTYVASSASSPQLALPIPAIGTAVSVPGSLRSDASSTSLATSTGLAASSMRSGTGQATSSLRKFLSGRPTMKGVRQMTRFALSDPKDLSHSSDKAPQLDWSLPKLDL